MDLTNITKTTRGIYFIKNVVNNKIYVGSSIMMRRRWLSHQRELNSNKHSNPYLQASWNEHGENNFKFILEKEMATATDKEIIEEEQKYIDLYLKCENGCYNISTDTAKPAAEANKIPILQLDKTTEEIIKEWPSDADIVRELGILSAGAAARGKEYSAGGFKWKFKDPILAAQFTPREWKGSSNKRKIYHINPIDKSIIKEFNTIFDTAAFYNTSRTIINAVCAGRRPHNNGLFFCYSDDYEKIKTKNLISPNGENIECKICHLMFKTQKSLGGHIPGVHKIETEQYTIDYLYNGVRPICEVENCNESTNYISFRFVDFCPTHTGLGKVRSGQKGGYLKKDKKALLVNGAFAKEYYGSTNLLTYKAKPLSDLEVGLLDLEEREIVAANLFKWFRIHGFPYPFYHYKELNEQWRELINAPLLEGTDLSTKIRSGSKIAMHFQSKNFFEAQDKRGKSLLSEFNKDETLMKVIRNRLGITYKECFNISGTAIREGFRASGIAPNISVFNSLVAKTLWDNVPEESVVLDYSMGFGHRMLGALSLEKKLTYIGIDPWKDVIEANRKIEQFINHNGRVEFYNIGAENFRADKWIGRVDMAFSSPPYENTEVYDKGNKTNASNLKGEEFYKWWESVVLNIKKYLKPETGIFGVNTHQKNFEKINNIILSSGFVEYKRYNLMLNSSHFARMSEPSKLIKSEPIVLYRLAAKQ